MCTSVLPTYIHVCAHVHAVPHSSEQGVRYPAGRVMDGCKLPHGCFARVAKALNCGVITPTLLRTSKYIQPSSCDWKFVSRMLEFLFQNPETGVPFNDCWQLRPVFVSYSQAGRMGYIYTVCFKWVVALEVLQLCGHKKRMSLFIGNHLCLLTVPKMSYFFHSSYSIMRPSEYEIFSQFLEVYFSTILPKHI